MQVVARTDEYTIYKKRNQRYAVRNKDRQWVRGEDKIAVLLAHDLIRAQVGKAAEPEAEVEPEAAPADQAAEAAAGQAEEPEAAAEADAADANAADKTEG